MTNRERAAQILNRMGRDRSAWAQERDLVDITSELDASERDGWIAALEWVIVQAPMWPAFRRKLAELKAEENKR